MESQQETGSAQQEINMENRNLAEFSDFSRNQTRKGYKENCNFSVKQIRNPDDSSDSLSIDEIQSILRYVDKREQYQTQEALILSFLSQNS